MSSHSQDREEEETVENFLGRLFDEAARKEEVEPEAENLLAAKLRARIKEQGPITVHDYMQACATDPEYGYYITRDPFGKGGDFITAPDICQVFGELLGLWCVHVWAELGQPDNVRLVELGPGRGTLMSDALRAASVVPEFASAITVHLVEASEALARVQEEQIRGRAKEYGFALPELHWHGKLQEVSEGVTLLIANEFLDALPIRQFQRTGDSWFERMVTLDEHDNFVFEQDGQPCTDLQQLPASHKLAKPGDIVEICPQMPELIEQLARRARQYPLAGLFIDYGYGEAAPGDTFQAVKAHEFADPLRDQGLADVTAHVDFGRFLELAAEQGLQGYGTATQRDFLIALGVRERAAQLMQVQENMMAAHRFITGFQRLIDTNEMGMLFKVAGVAGAGQPELPGFEGAPKNRAGSRQQQGEGAS